ncbi:MAG: tRNA (N(6)-L-threonylcarbamoyladenosine(37)-C(2))-methylthiotransferase MtaB [Oscillospiraceae bacterium]|jgi:threonylcarbamoyladenosine tRNA methylthiotransferase MtaB|nr:tRNA (N(6)-L-threonylcarbamoyladenosine(37)-C(2))-methylthiotransferase MtaB [Oscillospiraceae bacterium]
MNVHIITLGCKVNFCESESVSQMFLRSGYGLSGNIESAGVVVINSCSVTAEADRKTRQIIRKVRKTNPSCVLALMGCMPQTAGQEPDIFSEADIVIGNKDKVNVVNIVSRFINDRSKILNVFSFEKDEPFCSLPVCEVKSRSRAFLKIQDGCNKFCSYCVIPYARGRARSKSLDSILKDSKSFSELGFKEIVLVGINLSSYGCDIGSNLCEAVETVCSVQGICRVRLSSIDPQILTPDIVDRISKMKKLCPQFHLSLQSGSDFVLKSMNRPYTNNQYISIVKNIKSKIPKATITTDIMVGFPGETEDDFSKTLDIISEAEFLKVHVFPYSVRSGTKAAFMQNQIHKQIKTARVKTVMELSLKIAENLLRRSIGKTYSVLYEQKDINGFYEGYTENYILVKTKSEKDLKGKLLTTKIVSIQNNWCVGSIL